MKYSTLFTSLALFTLGCGSDDNGDSPSSGGVGVGVGGSTGVGVGVGQTAGSGGRSFVVPPDFTRGDLGGWKLGEPVVNDQLPETGSGGCSNQITGIVRDFKGLPGGHPDFEMDLENFDGMEGLVRDELGADGKPVYRPSGRTEYSSGPEAFASWYRSTPGTNLPFALTLFLVPEAGGKFSFESRAFFPLDDEGFGNQGEDHNFHFTFELHTNFVYNGGERFQFIGDDDVFVFVNGRLAIDLGGVHDEQSAELDLDASAAELGLQTGNSYPLDLFHAERQRSESNFRVDPTLRFTDCGESAPAPR
jgi:fibro-slime domain-containing protein